MANIKRKIALLICLVLSLVMIFVLSACGNRKNSSDDDDDRISNEETDTNSDTDTDTSTDTSTDTGADTPGTPDDECTHVEEIIPAVAPSCTETGLTEGKKCSVCGEILANQETVNATGHKFENYEVTLEPGCGTTGTKVATCENGCGKTDEQTIDATDAHKFENSYICTVCNNEIYKGSTGLKYTISGDGTYYIVSKIGTCTDTDIVIPYTYESLPVKEIGSYAFEDCDSLTSVEIPNSVTFIGEDAFYDCSLLTSVTIGNSVTSIGTSAFTNCTSLTSIVIPNSVTEIGGGAFCGCTSLTSIEIPDSVTSIGEGAFNFCLSLTSIEIPNSVTFIGEGAFSHCRSLTSIIIGNSVTTIGEGAFSSCTSLVYNEYDNAYYLGNETNPYLVLVKAKDKSITSCTVNENTKFIYLRAFSGCTSLTSVVIGNSVKTIEYSAFRGCTSLTSIEIPNSVTSIGYDAFYECYSLTIYCEATSKPSGWNYDWNYSDRPVYWYSESEPASEGNYWHYVNGEVVVW